MTESKDAGEHAITVPRMHATQLAPRTGVARDMVRVSRLRTTASRFTEQFAPIDDAPAIVARLSRHLTIPERRNQREPRVGATDDA